MFTDSDKKDPRRVGATVSVPGLGGPIGPAGFGPFDAIGIYPPYGGCPVYPPVPPPPPIGIAPFPPIVIDDRIIPPNPIFREVAVSASIAGGQVVAPGTIATVALGSLNFSVGGATISGNSLVLPRAGVYTVTASITVTRDAAIGSNIVTLSLVGGVLGGGVLESITLGPSESATLSGVLLVQAPNAGSQISFQISNSAGGGSVFVGPGTVGAKL